MFRNNNWEPTSWDVTEPRTDRVIPAARSSETINRQTITSPDDSGGGVFFTQQHAPDIARLHQLIADSCPDSSERQEQHSEIAQQFLMTGTISSEFLARCEFNKTQCQYGKSLKQLEKVVNENPLFIRKYRKEFVACIKKQSANTHFMLKDRNIYDDLLSISGSFTGKYESNLIQFERYANLVQPIPFIVDNNYWGLSYYNNWTRREGFNLLDFGPAESHFSFGIRTTHALGNVSNNTLSDCLNWIKPTYAEIVWGAKFINILEKIQMYNR